MVDRESTYDWSTRLTDSCWNLRVVADVNCTIRKPMLATSNPQLSSRRQILGAGLMAACGSWAALELLGERAASASAATATATRVSMVGDSLTNGTLRYQADVFSAAGWAQSAIDAYDSRGVRTKVRADPHTGLTAVDAIRATSGDSDLWIVALGTNDACIFSTDRYPELIRQMMDRIGSDHSVIWINIYLPSKPSRELAWNAALAAVAEERHDQMLVFDWASVAAQNQGWLSGDHVHYTGTGYQHRSTAIGLASRSLIATSAVPVESSMRRSWRPWLRIGAKG
jgi:lysophospholipase L1-like esterase